MEWSEEGAKAHHSVDKATLHEVDVFWRMLPLWIVGGLLEDCWRFVEGLLEVCWGFVEGLLEVCWGFVGGFPRPLISQESKLTVNVSQTKEPTVDFLDGFRSLSVCITVDSSWSSQVDSCVKESVSVSTTPAAEGTSGWSSWCYRLCVPPATFAVYIFFFFWGGWRGNHRNVHLWQWSEIFFLIVWEWCVSDVRLFYYLLM